MFDKANPLNRIKGETAKAHKAFMDYVDMGEGRIVLPEAARAGRTKRPMGRRNIHKAAV
jgi:hypothetical protein